MRYIREPELQPVLISDLHPTQMCVGMREVKGKRKELEARDDKDIGKYLGKHMIPVVLGRKERPYLVDHHHLALAIHEAGLRKVLVTVLADLSMVDDDNFWIVLDHNNWVRPYDAEGNRHDFSDMPESITDMTDDPYRSLAGALRREGGFAKETTPFSEFLWADFFRRRIKRKLVEDDFDEAMKEALDLAKSKHARYLPGWCGRSD